MNDALFLLIILAIGLGFYILFERMKQRHDDRKPHEENPIRFWLKGKTKDDDEP